jgi:hypothetical protein
MLDSLKLLMTYVMSVGPVTPKLSGFKALNVETSLGA